MRPIPILFLSDNPALPTGLGRITKDLAVHLSSLPQFRVGTLGRGGTASAKLPFAQYPFSEHEQWGERLIEGVWNDFAGSDMGVIMTIWDPSRLDWFTQPRMGGQLEKFLKSGRFKKWGYIPVDSYGIGGKLTHRVKDALEGYDRIIAYSIFGKQVLEDTLGRPVDWIPHGYNPKAFQPRDRVSSRMMMGFTEHDICVGCVMTNQARKDWGTAFGAIAHLKNRLPTVKFWCHVDLIERYWNILGLAEDFGLGDCMMLTSELSSIELSHCYSACDVTMLPSLGEGWGFPLTESMACGVPAIHTNYGGGVEQIPDKSWLVEPVATRLDTMWNCVRPVLEPTSWANTLYAVIEEARDGALRDVCTNAVSHLQWDGLWKSCWSKWFLGGIES